MKKVQCNHKNVNLVESESRITYQNELDKIDEMKWYYEPANMYFRDLKTAKIVLGTRRVMGFVQNKVNWFRPVSGWEEFISTPNPKKQIVI